jgi:hypothetical protein
VALTGHSEGMLKSLAQHQRRFGIDLFSALARECSMGRTNLLIIQLSALLSGKSTIRPVMEPESEMTWGVEGSKGLLAIESDASRIVVGHAPLFGRVTHNAVSMSSSEHVTFAVTTLDGLDLAQTQQILVVACGRCENTGMIFDQDRATVGRIWGNTPVLIEPVNGVVTLPKGHWKAWALDPTGAKKKVVPIRTRDNSDELVMSDAFATMWYLLVRQSI